MSDPLRLYFGSVEGGLGSHYMLEEIITACAYRRFQVEHLREVRRGRPP